MRISHTIATKVEGPLGEVIAACTPTPPTLEEVLASLAACAFVVETVAHLQGKEEQLLPTADEARRIISALQPYN